MCLDGIRFFVGLSLLLGFAKLFDQAQRPAPETTVESAAGASVDDVAELFGRKIEEAVETGQRGRVNKRGESLLVEIDAAVGELAEGPLLLEL